MSEVTTGSVPISLISPPVAIGAAILGAAYFLAKFCGRRHDNMLKEVQGADERLKWLDKQRLSSTKSIAEEANRLQKLVASNTTFKRMTRHMSAPQREILAGVIATERSPVWKQVPTLLDNVVEHEGVFQKALTRGTKDLALDKFAFVNSVVRSAAVATGFVEKTIVVKQTPTFLDIVFVDTKGRRLSAYCKINKEMNPSLAIDLEGFRCDDDECSLKMDEIIRYLQEHGVPFQYKRLKHNQPMGVLRKLLQEKAGDKDGDLKEYLNATVERRSQRPRRKALE